MAAEEENLDLEEETPVENKSKKVAKHDSGAADLEKVTDYVEEAEISSQDISNVRRLHRFFYYRPATTHELLKNKKRRIEFRSICKSVLIFRSLISSTMGMMMYSWNLH